jgi:hypothetical protein
MRFKRSSAASGISVEMRSVHRLYSKANAAMQIARARRNPGVFFNVV